MSALTDNDLRLLRTLIDSQLAPFRQAGLGLVAISAIAFLVGYLEWRDRGFTAAPPSTAIIAAGVGVALIGAGLEIWRRHRDPAASPLFRVLVSERERVTRIEPVRVVNSQWDRVIVHSTLTRRPTFLIVSLNDRDAVAELLARVYGVRPVDGDGRS